LKLTIQHYLVIESGYLESTS